ncbi:hypothetical protein K2173_005902 [Erythroxylum novogranatense]|uniref:Uncharacterized protein n=1 Tax=Erythroxylum novogranatense TaxID=1862640 RepID=A0AAV8U497_9ROSI|nr:hypothetical protein K2173_005902 [Erythroxylum novogranatense]
MDSKFNHQETEVDACVNAMIFPNSFLLPMIIKVAIDLNLFGIINKAGPDAHLSASEIASHLPTRNTQASAMLERILRFFASHSILSHSLRDLENGGVEHVYGLVSATRFFLGTGEEVNLTPLVELGCLPVTLDVWSHLKDAILGGGDLFTIFKKMSLFDYMDKDQTFNSTFNRAMAGIAHVTVKEVLAKYKGLEGVRTLVDVGGGTGTTLNMIISKYPSIKGINYDLPHVIESAPPYPGIKHVGGDMFTRIPKGDAVIMKSICHNWDDQSVVKFLRNIYQALPEDGKLIMINETLPEVPETSKSSQYVSRMDMIMFTLPGGKERTAKQYEALTRAAGFSRFNVACIVHGIWTVTESYK